ncbi:MAG: HEPN domain-containing protein [Bacteroidia bacterium]|nr:HEPN domain-containing protein [Bacteroidia bacterium]
MKDKANKLFTDASKKLNEANKELFKPKEDLVTYMVCKNAQFAVENYLKGFLLQNGVNPAKYKTVESLYEQCIKLNKKFEEVDLSDFNCKSHDLDSRYCNEVSKVSNCFDIADNLDTFLRREKIIN